MLQPKNLDELLSNRLDADDKEVNITKVPEWNQLYLDEHDPKFFDEFNKVINDEIIPETMNTNHLIRTIATQRKCLRCLTHISIWKLLCHGAYMVNFFTPR